MAKQVVSHTAILFLVSGLYVAGSRVATTQCRATGGIKGECAIDKVTIWQGAGEKIADASEYTEICSLSGYEAEENIIQTGDGYLLELHRLAYRKGKVSMQVNQAAGGISKNVVHLHYGLPMRSEVRIASNDQ
ncbi:lipase [Penicillium herquei]|nr:lipase [Penicillium herquei]